MHRLGLSASGSILLGDHHNGDPSNPVCSDTLIANVRGPSEPHDGNDEDRPRWRKPALHPATVSGYDLSWPLPSPVEKCTEEDDKRGRRGKADKTSSS